MKSQQKDSHAVNFICKEHKQKSSFICLHKTCSNAFKIGCPKCRKDHAQHPNRLIPVTDFHNMLSKPIKYLQNSTAFKLMNLKKKIEHIRNFRTSILQKELQLIESNKNIKSTISSILQQHYHIRDVVAHINTETLINNTKVYNQYIIKSKQFLAFNPVKGDLVFNNEVIKTSRVLLQKHLKTSHDITDSIRQFLVKIIQVLLANCAHEEDDEQIQLDQEGDNATNFNIFIKSRIDVTENPNIKSKLENQGFLQMFDEEKDALNQEIELLEKELDIKSSILNRIRVSNGGIRESNGGVRDSHLSQLPTRSCVNSFKIQSRVTQINLQIQTDIMPSTNALESMLECQMLQKEIADLKIKYEDISLQKQKQVEQIEQISKLLKQKCAQLQELKQKEIVIVKANEELKASLEEQQRMSAKMSQHMQQQEMEYMQLSQKNKDLLEEVQSLRQENQYVCQSYEHKIAEQKKYFQCQISQAKKIKNSLQTQIAKLKEQLEKREKDINREKRKVQELEKNIEKIKQAHANIEKQMTKNKEQYQTSEKKLRSQLQTSNKDIEKLNSKTKTDSQKIKHLQTLNKDLNKQIDMKDAQLREKEKDIKAKDDQHKEKNQTASLRIKFLQNQLKNVQNCQSTLKSYESEEKKFKEMKEMLEISIKKNQELKDKLYRLENQLLQLRENQQLEKASKISSSINIRETIGSEDVFTPKKSTIVTQKSESVEKRRVSKEVSINSPESKKKQKQILKDRKIITNKEDRKLAYLEIKNIFKVVTEDMNLLQQRLKQNNVIEKVYLKELQRKRLENKTLKKQLQSVKLYGSSSKYRATSPVSRVVSKQKLQTKMQGVVISSSSMTKTQSLTALGLKAIK